MLFGAKSVCKMNKILTNMLMKRVFLSLLAIFGVCSFAMGQEQEVYENFGVMYNLTMVSSSDKDGTIDAACQSCEYHSVVTKEKEKVTFLGVLSTPYSEYIEVTRNVVYTATPVDYTLGTATLQRANIYGQSSNGNGRVNPYPEYVSDDSDDYPILAPVVARMENVITYSELVSRGAKSVYGANDKWNDIVERDISTLDEYEQQDLFYVVPVYVQSGRGTKLDHYDYYVIYNINLTSFQSTRNITTNKSFLVNSTLPSISNATVRSLTLADEITSIAAGAFKNLSKLTSLNAGASPAEISATLLYHVKNYAPNEDKYVVDNGLVYKIDSKGVPVELTAILYGNDGKTYYIPETVEVVAPDAFVNVKNVTVISGNEDLVFTGTLTNGNKLQKPSNPLEVIKVNDKLGKVVGVVTSKNIKTVANTTYLVLDFSEAEISQSISLDEITGYPLAPNKLFYFGQLKEGITVTGQNVVVNGVCENFVMQDASAAELYIPTRFQAVKATLKRNFSAKDQYATLTVPFELSGSKFRNDFKPAILTKYEDGVVTLTYQGSVPANCPCIVRSKVSGITQLVRENVTVEVTTGDNSLSADQGDAVMYGTYAKTEIAVGSGNAYFNTYAAIRRPVGGNYVNAFRAYVYIPDFANVKVEFVGDDEEVWEVADGVKDVVKNEVTSEEYYSVNGTKLNEMQTGINVVKKTMSDGTVVTSKVVKK